MILRELLVKFGVSFDKKGAHEAHNAIEDLVEGAKSIAVAFAGVEAIKFLREFAGELAEAGGRLAHTSQSLGVTTDQLQELEFAARMSHVQADQLGISLQMVQKAAVDAAHGGQAQASVFRRLGVSAKDSHGQIKDAATLFQDVGAALGGLDNDSERTRYALALFGRQGRQLLPIFREGREGIARLTQEFHELGGGLSPETIESAEKYEQSLVRLDTAWMGLKSLLGAYVLPALEGVVTWMVRGVVAFRNLAEGTHVAQLGFYAFAAAAAAAGIAALAPFAETLLTVGLVVIAIGALILVVDDFLAMMDGGESVIGDFIDALFGLGSAQHFVEDLREGWKEIAEWIVTAKDALTNFFGESGASGSTLAPLQELRRRTKGGGEREGLAVQPTREQRQATSVATQQGAFAASPFFSQASGATTAEGLGRTVHAPRVTRSAPLPGGRVPQVSANVTTHAPITVNGAQDPRGVAALVRSAIADARDEDLRNAHDILTQGIEE